jgi:hypothetical protein
VLQVRAREAVGVMPRLLRPVGQPSTADHLEALARRPLQPRREVLLMLAARLRALEALKHGEPEHDQLELREVAA